MKTKFEQFIDEAKAVRLTAIEKRDLRRKLLEYVQMRPIRTETTYRLPLVEGATNTRGQLSHFSIFSFKFISGVTALFLMVGTGVSWAAEGALPGELLYPVKVAVNEEVVARLAAGGEGKAQWEGKRIERRLVEAEQLVVAGKFDSTAQALITSSLENHLSKATTEIKNIAIEPSKIAAANDLSVRLESKLRMHTQILSGLEGDGGDSADGIASAAAAGAMAVAEVRAEANEKTLANESISKQAALDHQLSSAKAKKELEDLITSNSDADLDVKDAVAKQLERIAELEISGKSKLEAGDYTGAFADYQKTVQLVEEAKVLFGVKKNLNIDITIVPTPQVNATSTATTTMSTPDVSLRLNATTTVFSTTTSSTTSPNKASVQVNLGL
jgi:hypothetical protein